MPQYFDNTRITAFRDCPRYYWMRHVRNWSPEGISLPLTFGLSWHAGMDVLWTMASTQRYADNPKDLAKLATMAFAEKWTSEGLSLNQGLGAGQEDMRNVMTANEMYYNYILSRGRLISQSELIACEQSFAVPIDLEGNIWYIGRLDKVLNTPQSGLVVLEHKTTSEYKKDGGFKDSWKMSFAINSQVNGYLFGGGQMFPGLKEVWVDGALVHKTVHDAFTILPTIAAIEGLDVWLRETRSWIQYITSATNGIEFGALTLEEAFPKNTNHCINKFGTCPFYNICLTNRHPDQIEVPPQGYSVKPWEPFDVLEIDKLGLKK